MQKTLQNIPENSGKVHETYVSVLRNTDGTKKAFPQAWVKSYKNKTLTKQAFCGNITEIKMVFRKPQIFHFRDVSVIVP